MRAWIIVVIFFHPILPLNEGGFSGCIERLADWFRHLTLIVSDWVETCPGVGPMLRFFRTAEPLVVSKRTRWSCRERVLYLNSSSLSYIACLKKEIDLHPGFSQPAGRSTLNKQNIES